MNRFLVEQTYAILAPTEANGDREALTSSGGFAVGGSVNVGSCESLADMPRILSQLQTWSTPPQDLGDPQPVLEPLGELSELPRDSPFLICMRSLHRSIGTVVDELTGEWVQDAVLTCIQDHEEYSKYGTRSNETDDLDESSLFFKLQLRPVAEEMSNVECMAAKVFAQTVLITLLYFRGAYYATVYDTADTEQTLLDSWFPDLSASLFHIQFKRSPHSQVETVELHVLPAQVAQSAEQAVVYRQIDDFGSGIDDFGSRLDAFGSNSTYDSSGFHDGAGQWGWERSQGLDAAPSSIFDMNFDPAVDEGDLMMDSTLLAATEAAMREMDVTPKSVAQPSLRPCHHVPPLSTSLTGSQGGKGFGSTLPLPATPLKSSKQSKKTSKQSKKFSKQKYVDGEDYSSKNVKGRIGKLSPPGSPPPPLPRYLNR